MTPEQQKAYLNRQAYGASPGVTNFDRMTSEQREAYLNKLAYGQLESEEGPSLSLQYRMDRDVEKDFEADIFAQANVVWSQGAAIMGEQAFDIKNERDLDAALNIAKTAAFVQPKGLAPGYAGLVKKLRQLKQQLGGQNGGDASSEEQADFERLKSKYGTQ